MNGRHIKIAGYGDPAKLGDSGNVVAFLDTLVATLGMRKLGELLFDVPITLEKLNVEPFEDEGGITGVAVLSTSHVSIHTWPLRNHFVADFYSCRQFDPERAEQVVTDYFGPVRMRLYDLSFALEGPHP